MPRPAAGALDASTGEAQSRLGTSAPAADVLAAGIQDINWLA
jgi:hypothetical protein